MEEGTLAKWLVSEGDQVSSGDIIAEIEADATMEFEAVDEGTIGKLLVAEGTENVKVNAPIAILLGEGESADDVPIASEQTLSKPAAPVDSTPAATVAAAAPQTNSVERTPDWPEGTPMKQQTVREALRDAMAEEMRADPNVFLMGEEVGEYQGAKVSQGLLTILAANV